jgi:hypothetical protein
MNYKRGNVNFMTLLDAKTLAMENFEALQMKLDQAVDLGYMDEGQVYYNSLSTLSDDAKIAESWDELTEVIYQGKALEEDIDTWLSLKGYTTIGLEWPTNSAD